MGDFLHSKYALETLELCVYREMYDVVERPGQETEAWPISTFNLFCGLE